MHELICNRQEQPNAGGTKSEMVTASDFPKPSSASTIFEEQQDLPSSRS